VYNKNNYNNTIDKIMRDYLENKNTIKEITEHEDLVVDFDITYTDGRMKNFTVNSEGNILKDEKELEDLEGDEYTDSKEEGEEEEDVPEGEITVYSTIRQKDGTKIKGVKINLYKINGFSPKLMQSLVTDVEGKVIFSGIPEGSYRVIEFIDKRYFNKPNYVDWNEVTINSDNKNHVIYAINSIKNTSFRTK
jgi:5-hydroxyisourate hydrolase-like protein (transthyretin family)